MVRIYFFLLVFYCLPTYAQKHHKNLNGVFDDALKLFELENPTEKTDQQALQKFEQVINQAGNMPLEQVLRCKSLTYAGVLYQLSDNQTKAKSNYRQAIDLQGKNKLADSLSFKPRLYLSEIYYHTLSIDSCLNELMKAEMILTKYPKLAESERLYNAYGALYFESGNYRLGKKYFEKAARLQASKDDFTLYNNLAICEQNLHNELTALAILKEQELKNKQNILLKINIASVLLDLNRNRESINYLSPLQSQTNENINLLLGKAYFQEKELSLAKSYFEKASQSNDELNKARAHYYLSKIARKSNAYKTAADHLEIAERLMKEMDGLQFAFEILREKVSLLTEMYQQKPQKNALERLLHTQNRLIDRAQHLIQTFDNESSKIELKTEIYSIFQECLKLKLSLYLKYKDEKWLKEAFEDSQYFKASILNISLKESDLKKNNTSLKPLYQQEKLLLVAKSVLRIKLQNTIDKAELRKKINDIDLKLASVQRQLEKDQNFKAQKYALSDRRSLEKYQDLLSNSQVLLSFQVIDHFTWIFYLNDHQLSAKRFKTENLLHKSSLLEKSIEKRDFDKVLARDLCQLIFPIKDHLLKSKTEVLIVPDAGFYTFPLETLIDDQNQFLIQNHAFSYLFSANFLVEKTYRKHSSKAAAFAPFHTLKSGAFYLPQSASEVKTLKDAQLFLGKKASKERFLKHQSGFVLLHLATHAIANNQQSENSYLQFSDEHADNKLYIHELHPSFFEECQLVFLSACRSIGLKETDGEGKLGLNRAFILAGAEHVISTLWNAEDYSTAYLAGKFYKYQSSGNTFQVSLQKAKKDLLSDPEMIQYHQPYYWAHVVLSIPQQSSGISSSKIIIYFLLTLVLIYLLWRVSKFLVYKKR